MGHVWNERFYGTNECTWYLDRHGRAWLVQAPGGMMTHFVAVSSDGPDDAALAQGPIVESLDRKLLEVALKLDLLPRTADGGCYTMRALDHETGGSGELGAQAR